MAIFRLFKAFLPLALAAFVIVLLDRHFEDWLDPGIETAPEDLLPESLLPSASAAMIPPKVLIRDFKVVLDPAYGGRAEAPGPRTGEDWSPRKGRYMSAYPAGSMVRTDAGLLYESQVLLDVARRVKERLDLTLSDETWPLFEQILLKYAAFDEPPVRIRVETRLSRDDDLNSSPRGTGDPESNGRFRVFDYPDVSDPLRSAPGRLSRFNHLGPHLILGINSGQGPGDGMRGFKSLFAPPYSFFERIRTELRDGRPGHDFRRTRYYQTWRVPARAGTRVNALRLDAAHYYQGGTGGDPDAGVLPVRDRLQWAYAQPSAQSIPPTLLTSPTGPFWDRERSGFEEKRRGQGPEGEGGDNLFAAEEIIRFIRYTMWADHVEKTVPEKDRPRMTLKDFEAYAGPHRPPVCSDWPSLIHTNAVHAYMELGYFTSPQDREFLLGRVGLLSDGIAVGVYSLLAGLTVRPVAGAPLPLGRRIDWEFYSQAGKGSHFDAARSGSGGATIEPSTSTGVPDSNLEPGEAKGAMSPIPVASPGPGRESLPSPDSIPARSAPPTGP